MDFLLPHVKPFPRIIQCFHRLKHHFLFFLQYFVSYIAGGTECLCCGKHTYAIPICKKCRRNFFKHVPFNAHYRCNVCGKELLSEKDRCLLCREKTSAFQADSIYPLFPYRFWYKTVLFEWKMNGVRTISPFFASLIHQAITEIEVLKGISGIPIVPVPPRPGKIKEKGWDQIDELCRFLHEVYNHRILSPLARNSVEQQKKLGRIQRLEKTKNAYSLVSQKKLDKIFSSGIPQTVLLLDDVMTTGATVEKCTSLLKTTGINSVCVLTLFIVD